MLWGGVEVGMLECCKVGMLLIVVRVVRVVVRLEGLEELL